MITYVADVMRKKLQTIDFYDGLRKAERLMAENNVAYLPVMKQGALAGMLTLKDIHRTHPNRIAADAMKKEVVSVAPTTPLWKAKQILEQHKVEQLPVMEEGVLVGIIAEPELLWELGKHIDLLTGLYRSDYIYYQGMELLNSGKEITVIFLDLNKFGVIDKEYGHTQGDIILKELGSLLRENTPADAYLCRFGGDEFALLVPYRLDKSKVLTENIINLIDSHVFSNKLTISAAAGIAGGRRLELRTHAPMNTISDLINLASLASTKAKKEKQRLIVAKDFCNYDIA